MVFSFREARRPTPDVVDLSEVNRFSERRGPQTPRRVPAAVVSIDGVNEPMEVDTRRRRPVDLSTGSGRFRARSGGVPATSLFVRGPDPDLDDADQLGVLDLADVSASEEGVVEVER